MLKVGDKIEIKKPKENKNDYEKTIDNIIKAIKKIKKDDDLKLHWCNTLYEVFEAYFDSSKELGTIDLKACMIAKNRFLPLLKKLIEEAKIENMASFFDVYKKTYAFCGRRNLECFIDYMEWDMPKKVLATRRDILLPFIYYLNEIAYSKKLEYIIASYPPSTGKSYTLNCFSAWIFGLNINNSILRLSYSEELVLSCSRTIQSFIKSPSFSDVFVNFKFYEGKPFSKEKESDWQIKNAKNQKNHIARTREGSTTGERANKAIIFDDMTKGASEAVNDSLHKQLYNSWTTEWYNRKDGDSTKFIFAGTMWSPEDILNRVSEDRMNVSEVVEDERFKYVWKTTDGTAIFIRVPLLDENDKTTCPEVMSTEKALNLRENTDEFLFSCVYQQNPIAPTGREFAYEKLSIYKEVPKDKEGNILGENYCMAVLDPARRGKDFVSMPIFKPIEGQHYFWDCIFKQKPMTDLYDEIVDKIIYHKIIKLVLENNTDTSLKTVIEDRLKEKGYLLCEIVEKYNTAKKEQRIKDNRGIVQRELVFRDKSLTKPNTDEGKFMENLTKYSFDYPNKHDDAPDSVCMYASEIVLNGSFIPKVEPTDRKIWGF